MTALVPNRFLFDFELPLLYRKESPRLRGDLADFDEEALLPPLCELDGQEPFAEVYALWNERGIYLGCRVTGKRRRPVCDARNFRSSDALRLGTDMRDTRDQKRAGRFCQAFYAMPAGGGRAGTDPMAGSHKLQRAREDARVVPPGLLPAASQVQNTGYTLELHLLAEHLSGFDPQEHQRIGFYYQVEDTELGKQSLTVGDELGWYVDPSTWATAVLVR